MTERDILALRQALLIAAAPDLLAALLCVICDANRGNDPMTMARIADARVSLRGEVR